jgi:hypothetical protein
MHMIVQLFPWHCTSPAHALIPVQSMTPVAASLETPDLQAPFPLHAAVQVSPRHCTSFAQLSVPEQVILVVFPPATTLPLQLWAPVHMIVHDCSCPPLPHWTGPAHAPVMPHVIAHCVERAQSTPLPQLSCPPQSTWHCMPFGHTTGDWHEPSAEQSKTHVSMGASPSWHLPPAIPHRSHGVGAAPPAPAMPPPLAPPSPS